MAINNTNLAVKMRYLSNVFLDMAIMRPDAVVDMTRETFRPKANIASFAGWWAIAHGLKRTPYYRIGDAIEDVAKWLGFSNSIEFNKWIYKNHHIWGNKLGWAMMYDRCAYGLTNRDPTLKEIGEHWLAASNRLEKNGIKSIYEM